MTQFCLDISLISIHAPTRGATCQTQQNLCHGIFQSTLPHGERPIPAGAIGRGRVANFNPRSHTGSDLLFFIVILAVFEFQSTLPHGERPRQRRRANRHSLFQSTLPHGERQLNLITPCYSYKFQSTLPHGERPEKISFRLWHLNFNPRSHTGSDIILLFGAHAGCYFNPRSHTGSDRYNFCCDPLETISIHAPTQGATEAITKMIIGA